MKKYSLLAFIAGIALTASCGGSAVQSAAGVDVPAEVKVGEVTLPMLNIEGGTFTMGKTPAGTRLANSTMHQVVLHGFSISAQPVSQNLWQRVMGSEVGSVKNPSAAADMVSYDDCVKFVIKLSKASGIPFSLPTEAQLEYAINSGAIECNVAYSEWCADFYSESLGDSLAVDPICTEKTELHTVRTPKSRSGESNYIRKTGLTFRVVVNTETAIPEDVVAAFIDRNFPREDVASNETVNVAGVSFRMIGVSGGTFDMGATGDMTKMSDDDEKPVHAVTLKGFEIGQTEVTAGQWLAIMGKLPYKNSEKELDKPVVNVSWYDCQEFILKLNKMTGRKFRLPTEAEWEFAARGGNSSRNNTFAGSMYVSQVAAYIKSAASEVMKVKQFQPNEIGIYDMSGNAWEWCQDSPYTYTEEAQTDPYFKTSGEFRMMRGGSAASKWDACRISNRSKIPACNVKSTFGFRLAI